MQHPHPNKPGTSFDDTTGILTHGNRHYAQTRTVRGLDVPTLVWECRNNQITPPGYRVVWHACDAYPSLRPTIYDRITFSESSRPRPENRQVRVSISLGTFETRREAEMVVEKLKPQIHELGAALAFEDQKH